MKSCISKKSAVDGGKQKKTIKREKFSLWHKKVFMLVKKRTFLAPWAVDLIAELVKEENTEWIENISQIATQFLFIKANSAEKVFFSTNRFLPLKISPLSFYQF